MSGTVKFTKVEDPTILLPLLKERHPQSCFMQNQVKSHLGFGNSLLFYTLGDKLNKDTWIVSDLIRKDYGSHVSISAPVAIVTGQDKIPDAIREAFISGGNVLNWDTNTVFVSLEKPVSKMIHNISVDVMGNVTETHPCNLYYMEICDALELEIKCPPLAEVRKLDAAKKEEMFIFTSWKYARPGSELDIRASIQVNASGGVFLDGKCVSGVNIPGYGLLSALYTLKDYRNKGYGKIAMNYAFREYAQSECIPCLTVECRNARSVSFHEKLGVKLVSIVDWIDVKKLEVD